MIQSRTILQVSDNSGAKSAICIKVLGGYKKRYAKIGDFVIVSIKTLKNHSKSIAKVKKGEVCKALVIRTKKPFFAKDGSKTIFSSNSITLVSKRGGGLLNTKVIGPILRELKEKANIKIISTSSGVV